MSAGEPFNLPDLSWEGFLALVAACGVGGIITAIVQRPSRRAVEAAAERDEATGAAAVITAQAKAFTDLGSGLREEIERLQAVAVRFETDLASAHARAVELEAQVEKLNTEIARLRGERDAALERVEMLNGELRQQQQVMASLARSEGK